MLGQNSNGPACHAEGSFGGEFQGHRLTNQILNKAYPAGAVYLSRTIQFRGSTSPPGYQHNGGGSEFSSCSGKEVSRITYKAQLILKNPIRPFSDSSAHGYKCECGRSFADPSSVLQCRFTHRRNASYGKGRADREVASLRGSIQGGSNYPTTSSRARAEARAERECAVSILCFRRIICDSDQQHFSPHFPFLTSPNAGAPFGNGKSGMDGALSSGTNGFRCRLSVLEIFLVRCQRR